MVGYCCRRLISLLTWTIQETFILRLMLTWYEMHVWKSLTNMCDEYSYSWYSQVLSKVAFISVTVQRVRGTGQLQFSRNPFTHWSFTFYEVSFSICFLNGLWAGVQQLL